jgi:hypothetical protein
VVQPQPQQPQVVQPQPQQPQVVQPQPQQQADNKDKDYFITTHLFFRFSLDN